MRIRLSRLLFCLFLVYFSITPGFFVGYADGTNVNHSAFSEMFTIGVDEAKDTKDEPYQFYTIISTDCDKQGNIYVLDFNARCVKKFDPNGIFVKRFFRQGKGPNEVANPFSISINKHNGHMFILQDYGFTVKEFDLGGNFVKYHVLPKQFFGSFHFLNNDEFVFLNLVPKKQPFDNFLVADILQKKIVKAFAPTDMEHALNHKQWFTISGNSVLWTCRGNEMKLLAFDLNTGAKIQEIQIPGKYKENTLLVKGKSGESQMVIPIFYNLAQPFVIDNQLFALVIIQEYEKKNGQIDRFPTRSQRIIYQVNGSRFEKLKTLEDGEGMYVAAVSKERLILYSNEPYARLKVLKKR